MSKKKFSVSPLLIEASSIVDTFEKESKPHPKPKRKNTIEAFTKKTLQQEPSESPMGSQGDSNEFPMGSQHDSNGVSTGFQRDSKGISRVFQGDSNGFPDSKGIPTPFQGYSKGIPRGSQQHFEKIILSAKQSIVYNFLIENQIQGIFNKPFIEKNTGVSYGTISDIIRKFKKLKILQITYNKFAKVYHYQINVNIKVDMPDFFSKINKRNPQGDSNGIPTPFQGDSNGIPTPFQGDSNGIPTPFQGDSKSYCSSSYIKTTTTNENNKINLILSENSEMGYWRQKQITSKQISKWMEIADCDIDMIIQYLCYCRFEMVDLDLEKSKPIKNVFNWFFKILEKTGGYPKPKGYKSFQDKKIAIERELIEKQENEALELKKLYQRKIEAEQDKKFWSMMSEPEGKLYKKCFEELNNFQKKKNKGKAFEMSMKDIFKKL